MSLQKGCKFLSKRGIIALHQSLITEHGSAVGIREEGLLESTLAKPQHLLNYEPDSTIFDLAAAYGYGFVQNHVFVDGNKRVGLAAMAAFLFLNGYEMTSSETEEVSIILSIATGQLSQIDLSARLGKNCTKR